MSMKRPIALSIAASLAALGLAATYTVASAQGAIVAGAFQASLGSPQDEMRQVEERSPKRGDKVVLSDKEWKKRLTPAQYRILRAHGTEAAFCGIFHDNKKKGTYHCAGCDLPLFKSDAKFDSGTGWPSFFQPVVRKNIWLRTDRSLGMVRYEVLCARCDGHLGHVFPDAPQTKTGLRFCINSDALTFDEAK
jgi:methionine-R-sulfoxide reductase